MKVYIDGSTTVVCSVIEEEGAFVQPALPNGEHVTSNEGEYWAAIHALRRLKDSGRNDEAVELLSDSQLLVNQMTTRDDGTSVYATKKPTIQKLRNELLLLIKFDFPKGVTFTWVPREENEAGKVLG